MIHPSHSLIFPPISILEIELWKSISIKVCFFSPSATVWWHAIPWNTSFKPFGDWRMPTWLDVSDGRILQLSSQRQSVRISVSRRHEPIEREHSSTLLTEWTCRKKKFVGRLLHPFDLITRVWHVHHFSFAVVLSFSKKNRVLIPTKYTKYQSSYLPITIFCVENAV